VIAHIGHRGDQTEERACDRVGQAVDRAFNAVPNAVRLLLENTAGQGTEIGYCLSHLQRIIAGSGHGSRLAYALMWRMLLQPGMMFLPSAVLK